MLKTLSNYHTILHPTNFLLDLRYSHGPQKQLQTSNEEHPGYTILHTELSLWWTEQKYKKDFYIVFRFFSISITLEMSLGHHEATVSKRREGYA